ncbi:MAG: hypothetical protein AAF328_04025 [Planctomycetota bacterium]
MPGTPLQRVTPARLRLPAIQAFVLSAACLCLAVLQSGCAHYAAPQPAERSPNPTTPRTAAAYVRVQPLPSFPEQSTAWLSLSATGSHDMRTGKIQRRLNLTGQVQLDPTLDWIDVPQQWQVVAMTDQDGRSLADPRQSSARINPSRLDVKMFNAYRQGQASRARAAGGTPINLAAEPIRVSVNSGPLDAWPRMIRDVEVEGVGTTVERRRTETLELDEDGRGTVTIADKLRVAFAPGASDRQFDMHVDWVSPDPLDPDLFLLHATPLDAEGNAVLMSRGSQTTRLGFIQRFVGRDAVVPQQVRLELAGGVTLQQVRFRGENLRVAQPLGLDDARAEPPTP